MKLKPPTSMPATLTTSDPDYGRERFTVAQAAVYLDIHPSHVYSEAAAGNLSHRRDTTHRLRFSQQDLDEWRAARRVPARPHRRESFPLEAVPSTKRLPLPSVRRFS